MALYHFSVKTASRSKGGRAADHMLYVAREGRYAREGSISQDEFQYISREGDYTTRADELYHVEHYNLPEWASENPVQFWAAADKHERANGRLYTELEFSLPRELNLDQRLELAQEFAAKTLGTDHPYTLAVHNSIASDGGEQPHVHLMCTERKLDGVERPVELFFRRANSEHPDRGGAKKDRAWSKQEKVEALRESWEKTANGALARAGFSERIDRRSLKAQGIHREPQPRIGPVLSKLIKEKKLSRDAVIQALLKARRGKEASKTVGQHQDDKPTYLKASEVQKEVQTRVARFEAELTQLLERRNQLGYETANTLEVVEAQARRRAEERIGGSAWIQAKGQLRSATETLKELEIRRSLLEEQHANQGMFRHLPWVQLRHRQECREWEEAYREAVTECRRASEIYENIQAWLSEPAQQQRILSEVSTLVAAYQKRCQEREELCKRCDLLRSHVAKEQLYSRSLEVFGNSQLPFRQNELGQWMPATPKVYVDNFLERTQLQHQMLQRCRERKRDKREE